METISKSDTRTTIRANDINKRVEKAIEVKKALKNLGISEDLCINLKKFSKLLNEWVKYGHYDEGKIKLIEINRNIIYQLRDPDNTVVKLTII
jgi:hypothetical protein